MFTYSNSVLIYTALQRIPKFIDQFTIYIANTSPANKMVTAYKQKEAQLDLFK